MARAPLDLPVVAADDSVALAPPLARLVERPRLVERLRQAQTPLIVLRAPAGYGKTALLEQWSGLDEREFAWVRLGAAGADSVLLDELARQLDGGDRPRVLVLDDVHALEQTDVLLLVADIATRQPRGSLVALATRGEPALPLGRLRVQGAVLELGPDDLALTSEEGAALLRDAQLEVAHDTLETLRERVEGWPAGMRMAALAAREQTDAGAAVVSFDGEDRFVADYLRDTLLAGLAPEQVAFLRRSAPLGELSGPLCDAVLERHGSGDLLRTLARADLLVTAVDRRERRFRLHPLLAGMLSAELSRSEPELAPCLHSRASAWHDSHGDVPRALEHALLAGELDQAGELLWSVAGGYSTGGRNAQLGAWLELLDDAVIDARPPLALASAVQRLQTGDRDTAERLADLVEGRLAEAPQAQRASLQAGLAIVRAGLGRGGAEQLRADAGRARALAGDGVWRSSACLLEGVGQRLLGAPDAARERLALATRPGAQPTPTVHALALALQALLELERDDVDAALALAEGSQRALEQASIGEEPACALAHAAAAAARAHAGQVEQAHADAERGRRLLAALPDPAPWYAAETTIALARAMLRLSDCAEARELLGVAGRHTRALSDASGLRAALDAAWERADSFAIDAVAGPSALTLAELRVLRFLPSHLSFREIAGRLHVSANTVKTQAHAVYRKLDASSRSEAVARARLVGLVDG